MSRKLTAKQHAFGVLAFKTGEPGLAYMEIYKVKSMAVASVCASKLLTNAKIQELTEDLRKRAEDDSVATVLERKQVLTEILRGRVADYTKNNRINVEPESLNTAAIQEINTSELKIGQGESALLVEITKLKLHDPIRAIDILNKMGGDYAPERYAHLIVELEKGDLTDEQLAFIAGGGDLKGGGSEGTSK